MVTQFSAFSVQDFYCDVCDVKCSKKNDYKRHILTQKHRGNVEGNKNSAKTQFTCDICKKEYKSRKGLWSHNKICNNENNAVINNENNIENNVVINNENNVEKNIENNTDENSVDSSNNIIHLLIKEHSDFKNLVLELVKSNTKLQEQMLEICKNNQPSSIITNNSHNKTFNLQFFLNEQCKNAMNLNEFVGSFELELEDLLMIGEQGYVEGITRIILEKLKALDIYKRPIHCSDLRRDSLFIRTDNVWCKEEPGNEKMAIAIKDIGKQNFLLLNEYREMHPDCLNHDSEFNDPYVKLIMQAAGGCVKENIDKIIKKIAKEVVIDKTL